MKMELSIKNLLYSNRSKQSRRHQRRVSIIRIICSKRITFFALQLQLLVAHQSVNPQISHFYNKSVILLHQLISYIQLPWVCPKYTNLLTIQNHPCHIFYTPQVDNNIILTNIKVFRQIKNITIRSNARVVLNALLPMICPIAQLLKNSTFGPTKLLIKCHIPLTVYSHYHTLLFIKRVTYIYSIPLIKNNKIALKWLKLQLRLPPIIIKTQAIQIISLSRYRIPNRCILFTRPKKTVRSNSFIRFIRNKIYFPMHRSPVRISYRLTIFLKILFNIHLPQHITHQIVIRVQIINP